MYALQQIQPLKIAQRMWQPQELKVINNSRFFILLYKGKLTRCEFSLVPHSSVMMTQIKKHKTSKNDKQKLKLV